MLNLFRRFFGKTGEKATVPVGADDAGSDPFVRRTETGLAVDLDRVAPSAREALYEELLKQNQAPLFEGEVEHGYTKAAVGGTATCPRCRAPTRQHCAHFVYATDIATRVMLAPAGFFCSQCPTVIVDEGMIAVGVKEGFQFRGVVGIDFAGKREMALFRTWNGRKPVYILDENEQIMGLSTVESSQATGARFSSSQRKKLKNKRKMAKHSRQRNRRR